MPNPRAQKNASFGSTATGVYDAITKGLLPMIGNAARGSVAATLGAPGDILGLLSDKQPLPTSQNILDYIPPVGSDKALTGMAETMGGFIPTPGAGAVAKGAARAVKTALNPMTYGRAFMEAQAPAVMSRVYLPDTPSKPNPLVGTRFQREFVGNQLPKQQLTIEDLKGQSLLTMPWDLTSRGYSVKSVSDELLGTPVVTKGGQMYASDAVNQAQDIVGASNEAIANRIVDRAKQAQIENAAMGGSGDVNLLASTMGDMSEGFSVDPTEIIMQLAARGTKKDARVFDKAVREAKVKDATTGKLVQPFKKFAGILDPFGQQQVYTGSGLGSTAGELRKAITAEAAKTRTERLFDYNYKDLLAAITDPYLAGAPLGMAGNTVIRAMPEKGIAPGLHPAYSHDFFGKYQGSLGNLPIEVLFPKQFAAMQAEFLAKHPKFANEPKRVRQAVIGMLEKRKAGVSEYVDDQVIDSVNQYLLKQTQGGLLTP